WPIMRRQATAARRQPAGESRRAKVARYLAHCIDRVTGNEDAQLIKWSWESMQSSGFSSMILSDLEAGVRDYHDKLRETIPVVALNDKPAKGQVKTINQTLLSARH
ncbi:MAG: hypothetical protein E6G89_00280, partial [Alphaproteobacteria bacterium]